jgi:hypothetical protein
VLAAGRYVREDEACRGEFQGHFLAVSAKGLARAPPEKWATLGRGSAVEEGPSVGEKRQNATATGSLYVCLGPSAGYLRANYMLYESLVPLLVLAGHPRQRVRTAAHYCFS